MYTLSINCSFFRCNIFYLALQVTLVYELAKLFLIEMVFGEFYQIIYLKNFKKWNEHTLFVFFY